MISNDRKNDIVKALGDENVHRGIVGSEDSGQLNTNTNDEQRVKVTGIRENIIQNIPIMEIYAVSKSQPSAKMSDYHLKSI